VHFHFPPGFPSRIFSSPPRRQEIKSTDPVAGYPNSHSCIYRAPPPSPYLPLPLPPIHTAAALFSSYLCSQRSSRHSSPAPAPALHPLPSSLNLDPETVARANPSTPYRPPSRMNKLASRGFSRLKFLADLPLSGMAHDSSHRRPGPPVQAPTLIRKNCGRFLQTSRRPSLCTTLRLVASNASPWSSIPTAPLLSPAAPQPCAWSGSGAEAPDLDLARRTRLCRPARRARLLPPP
jgi:hypothetical protein